MCECCCYDVSINANLNGRQLAMQEEKVKKIKRNNAKSQKKSEVTPKELLKKERR